MLSFSVGKKRFNYRVVGIANHEDHVLLHKEDKDSYWSLPGGRPEWFESSTQALCREMVEELGEQVEIGSLRWIVENFYRQRGQERHELAFYYDICLPEQSELKDVSREYRGRESFVPMTFKWFPVGELKEIIVFPTFLPEYLPVKEDGILHLVHKDPYERKCGW